MSDTAPGVSNPEVQGILDELDKAQPGEPEQTQVQTAEATPATTPEKQDAKPAEPEKDKQGNVRNALRASRHAEKVAREQLEAAQRELEELRKANPKPEVSTNLMNDEEFALFKEEYPAYAAEVEKAQKLQAQIEQLTKAQPQTTESEFRPTVYEPEIQNVIDLNDDLLAWQNDPESQDKFNLAVQYDSSLLADPDWKDKPLAERFEEAVKRTKRKLSEKEPKKDPSKVINDAPTNRPKGISDFRGGAPANAPAIDYHKMSTEDILASLPQTDD